MKIGGKEACLTPRGEDFCDPKMKAVSMKAVEMVMGGSQNVTGSNWTFLSCIRILKKEAAISMNVSNPHDWYSMRTSQPHSMNLDPYK